MKSDLFIRLLAEVFIPDSDERSPSPKAKSIEMREVVVDGQSLWVRKEHHVALLQS